MKELCTAISMPEEVTAKVLEIHQDPAFHPSLQKLLREETWAEGLDQLRQELGEDPLGLRMLTAQLRCALQAWETYEKLGISRQIYVDTMAAFSRFVREHMDSFGAYGFDRGFWTVRQVSCKLFRVGELEYELHYVEGSPFVSLHVPSDIHFGPEGLRASWEQAKGELLPKFPEYETAPMGCDPTWLLSPELKEMLPEKSNILAFQKSFQVEVQEPEMEELLQWVFKDPRLSYEQLPEDTSLQRKIKALLLSGRTFHFGSGLMVADPFRS